MNERAVKNRASYAECEIKSDGKNTKEKDARGSTVASWHRKERRGTKTKNKQKVTYRAIKPTMHRRPRARVTEGGQLQRLTLVVRPRVLNPRRPTDVVSAPCPSTKPEDPRAREHIHDEPRGTKGRAYNSSGSMPSALSWYPVANLHSPAAYDTHTYTSARAPALYTDSPPHAEGKRNLHSAITVS